MSENKLELEFYKIIKSIDQYFPKKKTKIILKNTSEDLQNDFLVVSPS